MFSNQLVEIYGQRFQLLSNRTIFWEEQQAILLADTHFGKAATFRNRGIPVPVGTTRAMLDVLTQTIQMTGAKAIYFLGDFVHSHTRHAIDFEDELVAWRQQHADTSMTLILGNHDRGQQALFRRLDLNVVAEPHAVAGVALCHFPETPVEEGQFRLAGHLHPALKLNIAGDRMGKQPCFYFTPSTGILPAFGEFTGTATVKPKAEDRVFIVADGEVAELSLSLRP